MSRIWWVVCLVVLAFASPAAADKFFLGPFANEAFAGGDFYTGGGVLGAYMPITIFGFDGEGEFGARFDDGETIPQWRVATHIAIAIIVARLGVSYAADLPRDGAQTRYLGPELYVGLPLIGDFFGEAFFPAAGLVTRLDFPLDDAKTSPVFTIGLNLAALFGFGDWEG